MLRVLAVIYALLALGSCLWVDHEYGPSQAFIMCLLLSAPLIFVIRKLRSEDLRRPAYLTVTLVTLIVIFIAFALTASWDAQQQRRRVRRASVGDYRTVVTAPQARVRGAGGSGSAAAIQVCAERNNLPVDYQVLGSKAGVPLLLAREIDFTTLDCPIDDDNMGHEELIRFPIIAHGISVVVNVEGISSRELRLSGPILAEIFLGKIRQWNDEAIQLLNPELELPDLEIVPFSRSDSCGLTANATTYLASVSSEWQRTVGLGTRVNWPCGSGTKQGLSHDVQQTPGAIAFMEHAFAERSNLTLVRLQNSAGNFVAPGDEAFAAALRPLVLQDVNDWKGTLVNQPGEDAWPIVGLSFALIHTEQNDAHVFWSMKHFFRTMITGSGSSLREHGYTPLPINMAARIEAELNTRVRITSGY